jgi:hypothetical protein
VNSNKSGTITSALLAYDWLNPRRGRKLTFKRNEEVSREREFFHRAFFEQKWAKNVVRLKNIIPKDWAYLQNEQKLCFNPPFLR